MLRQGSPIHSLTSGFFIKIPFNFVSYQKLSASLTKERCVVPSCSYLWELPLRCAVKIDADTSLGCQVGTEGQRGSLSLPSTSLLFSNPSSLSLYLLPHIMQFLWCIWDRGGAHLEPCSRTRRSCWVVTCHVPACLWQPLCYTQLPREQPLFWSLLLL